MLREGKLNSIPGRREGGGGGGREREGGREGRKREEGEKEGGREGRRREEGEKEGGRGREGRRGREREKASFLALGLVAGGDESPVDAHEGLSGLGEVVPLESKAEGKFPRQILHTRQTETSITMTRLPSAHHPTLR